MRRRKVVKIGLENEEYAVPALCTYTMVPFIYLEFA